VDPHEYLLEAPQCRALLEDVPSRGYVLLDATRQELRFADASPIRRAALSPEDRGALEAEIGARIPGLELHAGSLPWADFAETRIQPADVVGPRSLSPSFGYVGDGSSCAVYPVASAASQPRPPLQLDRFAYLLEPDGRVLVIRVGLGC
jgi:hypothetical protein